MTAKKSDIDPKVMELFDSFGVVRHKDKLWEKRERKPKTVELVKAGYQPTKREMEEEFSVHKKDGSETTLSDLTDAILRSVDIRLINKPRDKR